MNKPKLISRIKTIIKERRIIEFIIFTIITISIVITLSFDEQKTIDTEAILLSVVIFAIYLIVSGRISELKFQDLDIKINDAKEKPLTISTLSEPFTHSVSDIEDAISNYITTENDVEKVAKFEKYIIPKLIRQSKDIRILKISRRENQSYSRLLFEHIKYFNNIIFLDSNNRLSGFSSLTDIEQILKIKEDQSKKCQFINDINNWKFDYPFIHKDYFILKDISRKQVLEKMNKLGLKVLPVVSADLIYEGIIDYETIIRQINNEIHNIHNSTS